jgi:predicted O-methyltransferase YrrM
VADPSDANPHVAVEAQRAAASRYGRETDLARLDEFNKAVARSERIESWLVPLWDGVMVGRLVD